MQRTEYQEQMRAWAIDRAIQIAGLNQDRFQSLLTAADITQLAAGLLEYTHVPATPEEEAELAEQKAEIDAHNAAVDAAVAMKPASNALDNGFVEGIA